MSKRTNYFQQLVCEGGLVLHSALFECIRVSLTFNFDTHTIFLDEEI